MFEHFLFYSFADSAKFWQFGFQDSATPIMEGLINLHHHIFYFLIIIAVFVVWLIFRTLTYFYEDIKNNEIFYNISLDLYRSNLNEKKLKSIQILLTQYASKLLSFNTFTHNYLLEIIWTIIPTLILILIAIPSFVVLYCMDEVVNASITLKVIGHQWYWSYEYSDYFLNFSDRKTNTINFDSYMIPEDELKSGQLRLLEVDSRVVLPTNVNVRILVTAADVLHSWAVPSLGIKIDAVPGRLNQGIMFIKRPGIFYGQCSEICGVNHGFMPIVVEAVELKDYLKWIEIQKTK